MSARSKSDTRKGSAPGPTLQETIDIDPTLVEGPNAGPTIIDGQPTALETPRPPIIAVSKKDAPAPIQAISMKTPGHGLPAPSANPPTPALARPMLRGIAEVAQQSRSTGPVQNLGNLAQPYDPRQARARAVREYVIWGCLAVILASGIALVVWFVAR